MLTDDELAALERAVERLEYSWRDDRTEHHDADLATLRALADRARREREAPTSRQP